MTAAQTYPRHRTFRAIFISDLHLGTRHCQADLFVEFLNKHESDRIYLIGDIVDGWRLKKSWYWPQSHDDAVQVIPAQRSPTSPETMTSSSGGMQAAGSTGWRYSTGRSTRRQTAAVIW